MIAKQSGGDADIRQAALYVIDYLFGIAAGDRELDGRKVTENAFSAAQKLPVAYGGVDGDGELPRLLLLNTR